MDDAAVLPDGHNRDPVDAVQEKFPDVVPEDLSYAVLAEESDSALVQLNKGVHEYRLWLLKSEKDSAGMQEEHLDCGCVRYMVVVSRFLHLFWAKRNS